jgi:hypothetical protein
MENQNGNANLPARKGGPDAFRTYADACAPRTIVGTLLKFSKGDFLAGEGGEAIADDVEFTALMDELLVGWVRWDNGKLAETRMGRVTDGFVPPPRRDLGDLDAAAWETDAAGNARDPWAFQNYLPLKRIRDDELFTFVAGSRGALNAVAELCRIHSRHGEREAGHYPVVRLRSDEYAHKKKEYGRIKFPVLGVVGWTSKEDLPEQATPEEPPFDDELPL